MTALRLHRPGGTLANMRFADQLRDRAAFPVSIEITPPRKAQGRVLLRRAGLLGERACAVNVIQRAERQTSLDASIELLAAGFDPVWHLVTRGRTRDAIREDIARAHTAGIQSVLCIRGDGKTPDRDDTPTIRETIQLVVEGIPGVLAGATANQYGPRDPVLKNLWPKLAAGARYVQTQPVFSFEGLRPLAEAIRDRSPETLVVAMVMPLVSSQAVQRVPARLGVELPAGMGDAVLRGGGEEGWSRFRDTWAELAASDLVDGVAVMTFEMDPGPEFVQRLVSEMDRGRA